MSTPTLAMFTTAVHAATVPADVLRAAWACATLPTTSHGPATSRNETARAAADLRLAIAARAGLPADLLPAVAVDPDARIRAFALADHRLPADVRATLLGTSTRTSGTSTRTGKGPGRGPRVADLVAYLAVPTHPDVIAAAYTRFLTRPTASLAAALASTSRRHDAPAPTTLTPATGPVEGPAVDTDAGTVLTALTPQQMLTVLSHPGIGDDGTLSTQLDTAVAGLGRDTALALLAATTDPTLAAAVLGRSRIPLPARLDLVDRVLAEVPEVPAGWDGRVGSLPEATREQFRRLKSLLANAMCVDDTDDQRAYADAVREAARPHLQRILRTPDTGGTGGPDGAWRGDVIQLATMSGLLPRDGYRTTAWPHQQPFPTTRPTTDPTGQAADVREDTVRAAAVSDDPAHAGAAADWILTQLVRYPKHRSDNPPAARAARDALPALLTNPAAPADTLTRIVRAGGDRTLGNGPFPGDLPVQPWWPQPLRDAWTDLFALEVLTTQGWSPFGGLDTAPTLIRTWSATYLQMRHADEARTPPPPPVAGCLDWEELHDLLRAVLLNADVHAAGPGPGHPRVLDTVLPDLPARLFHHFDSEHLSTASARPAEVRALSERVTSVQRAHAAYLASRLGADATPWQLYLATRTQMNASVREVCDTVLTATVLTATAEQTDEETATDRTVEQDPHRAAS